MKKLLFAGLGLGAAVLGACSLTSCGSSSKEAVKIGIPSDGTNLSRGIKLLETAGLIEVDPAAGYTPEMKDITKYIYNIEIEPTTANTLPNLLDDFGACTINGTYAIPQGLVPSKDALLIEKQSESGDNPYVNIIVSRTADKDNETYKTICEAFNTQTVAEYILTAFNEAFYPVFDYESFTAEQGKATYDTVAAYKTSLTKATASEVVVIGVCGANNSYFDAVQYVLDRDYADKKILIELKEFSAYNLPNEALNAGDIDLNSFQHKAYLSKDSTDNNYDLSIINDTFIAPLSLYSHKYKSVDEIKAAAGLKA